MMRDLYLRELPTTRYQRFEWWMANSRLSLLDENPGPFFCLLLTSLATTALQVWFWTTEDWWPVFYPLTLVPTLLTIAAQVVISRGRSKAIHLEDGRYSNYPSSHTRQVMSGHRAFIEMEPVLAAESREIYRAMIRCLRRWQIAKEPVAMEAAARRGLLLQDIKTEGRLTRAHQIPLDDDSDLSYGQNIVEAMRQIRRELS